MFVLFYFQREIIIQQVYSKKYSKKSKNKKKIILYFGLSMFFSPYKMTNFQD